MKRQNDPIKIDIVITWVDGNDPQWQAEKAKYQDNENSDGRTRRYRSWDNLQYLFRGIEKFAPWVNKVFFVTCGHLPKWLNLSCEKLVVVNHKDFIPEEYLPTFSCRPIELNLHRIPGLSEHFVYFNDDMFLTALTKETDFFVKGLPCDTAILNAYVSGGKGRDGASDEILHTAVSFDMAVINRNFDKREAIRKNFTKWFNLKYGIGWLRTVLLLPWRGFTGLMSYHLPYSLLKSTYEEVWEKEGKILERACRHKFRDLTDVNSWVFSYWQIVKGQFYPRSPKVGNQYLLRANKNTMESVLTSIREKKYKMICLNDGAADNDFDGIKVELNRELDRLLPEKSAFEI